MDRFEWAKNEIQLAKKELDTFDQFDRDYMLSCYESALKAFSSLLGDEHSGYSIHLTKDILVRMIEGKPLTAIYDTPDIWDENNSLNWNGKDFTTYQCKRMSSLFKDVYSDGTVKYNDVQRIRCQYNDDDSGALWSNGFINNLISDIFPITMPYMPKTKPYIVECTEVKSNGAPANCDYDILAVWNVHTPDGEEHPINRFFKDTPDGWSEITVEEYRKFQEEGFIL